MKRNRLILLSAMVFALAIAVVVFFSIPLLTRDIRYVKDYWAAR